MNKLFVALSAIALCASQSYAWEVLQAVQIKNNQLRPGQIQLKNDSMPDEGGQGFLQQGFVAGEKAGIWVQVPATVKQFKVDAFRVLMASGARENLRTQVFFQMGSASQPSTSIAGEIENAAEVTPGPYWNDIPAQGLNGGMSCVSGGQYVGAALEFTHSGLPSVFSDFGGLTQPKHNLLYAIPGGWNLSATYGLTGDWVLRVVGHEAKEGECK